MRVLWRDDEPTFDGRFVGFAGIQSRPRPVQAGGPPIVVGGASDAAIERAVRVAQGWYGFAMDVEAARGCIERLGAAQSRWGRDDELGELEISVTPRGRLTADLIERFADIGVHRLIPMLPQDIESKALDTVAELGSLAHVDESSIPLVVWLDRFTEARHHARRFSSSSSGLKIMYPCFDYQFDSIWTAALARVDASAPARVDALTARAMVSVIHGGGRTRL